jgi:hypothetical protein
VVELLERAREQTWYRTPELPGGEVTPGICDLRSSIDHATPEDLDALSTRHLRLGDHPVRFAVT